MTTDRQGNQLTGTTAESIEYFNNAIRAFNIYDGDPVALLDSAIAVSPECTSAHIAKGWLFALATEPEANAEAVGIVNHAKTLKANEREQSQLAALEKLTRGDWTGASQTLDFHNMRYPRDLLALQVGHLTDFYRANNRDMRDRIARALPSWSESDSAYANVLGMYSFGLEESGDYARAEDAGRRATELDPPDCWAHHAIAHVLEMQGRTDEGIHWMISREPHWSGENNFFKVHNWWHRALWHLDRGETETVFRLYDGPIREDRSQVALDMVDASALLWRLTISGHDVGTRWDELATSWDQHADGRLYGFNDLHAAMAWLGAGREGDVEQLIEKLRQHPAHSDIGQWSRQIALPLVEGFFAFWRGDYATAVDRLHRGRYVVNGFGGSHAQRDIIDWTLIEAAIKDGDKAASTAIANERLALKPASPVNRLFRDRALDLAA